MNLKQSKFIFITDYFAFLFDSCNDKYPELDLDYMRYKYIKGKYYC